MNVKLCVYRARIGNLIGVQACYANTSPRATSMHQLHVFKGIFQYLWSVILSPEHQQQSLQLVLFLFPIYTGTIVYLVHLIYLPMRLSQYQDCP